MEPYKRLFISGDITVTFTWKIPAQTRVFSHGFPQKAFGPAESWAHISSLWLPGAAPWQNFHSLMVIPEKQLPRRAEWAHILDKPHSEMQRVERNNCDIFLMPPVPPASSLSPSDQSCVCWAGRSPSKSSCSDVLGESSWAEQNQTKPFSRLFHHREMLNTNLDTRLGWRFPWSSIWGKWGILVLLKANIRKPDCTFLT